MAIFPFEEFLCTQKEKTMTISKVSFNGNYLFTFAKLREAQDFNKKLTGVNEGEYKTFLYPKSNELLVLNGQDARDAKNLVHDLIKISEYNKEEEINKAVSDAYKTRSLRVDLPKWFDK